jgi:hypothetical protein
MAAEAFAHVAVEAEVFEKVVALEDGVLLDEPQVPFGHERREDRRGNVGMVVAAERVADVVEQRAHHVLGVAAVALRPARGLQAMLEPADGIAAGVACEQAEVGEHAVRQLLVVGACVRGDHAPVLGGSVAHLAEALGRRLRHRLDLLCGARTSATLLG